MEKGNLNIRIDSITPCLFDVEKEEEVPTEAFRVYRNQLKGYNSKTGWYVNWEKLSKDHEIYALRVKGSQEIEGLAAIRNDEESEATIFEWAVANPRNNAFLCKEKGISQKYSGVGGHLFAIAIDCSIAHGHDGVIIGHPSNRELMAHYIESLGAEEFPFATGYAYTIVIWEEAAKNLKERYSYEKAD